METLLISINTHLLTCARYHLKNALIFIFLMRRQHVSVYKQDSEVPLNISVYFSHQVFQTDANAVNS